MEPDDATACPRGGPVATRRASFSGVVRRIRDRLKCWKWLVFFVCAIVFVVGPAIAAFDDAERYDETEQSDWIPTNMWLKSAECAREVGAWLAICEGDRLVPMSEYSFGDDPGHALSLELWAMAADSAVSLVEVARLNVVLNTAGLVVLAGFLFALRAWLASIALLLLGPVAYLQWNGVSPHWGLIGTASVALILPMALVARDYGLLSRRSGNAWIAAGMVGLALAALLREPIGVMCLAASLAVVGFLAVRRLRARQRLRDLLVIAPFVLVASAATTWAVMARDASFEMAPAQRVATHNFSHTLYIGLGAVPNAFGLRYDDAVARLAVARVAPDVLNSSPEYYRILWSLYWSRIRDAPAEVIRIYFEKAKLILADPILDSAPPLLIVVIVMMVHLAVVTAFGMWRRIDFAQGVLIEGAALALVGLFVVQAILASHNRMFAMPMGAGLLMLLGVLLEFGARCAIVLVAQAGTGRAASGGTSPTATPLSSAAREQHQSN